MTNTNTDGCGIYIDNSEVEIVDVAIKRCRDNGLTVHSDENLEEKEQVVLTRCQFIENGTGISANSLSNIKMTDCIVRDNEEYGMFMTAKTTIDVHGEATAIHSNGRMGIYAKALSKVFIHLPSHHNTIYNNGGEEGEERENRYTDTGATITNVED